MTGQCKLCLQLVTPPPPNSTPDPHHILAMRALATATRIHYQLVHREQLDRIMRLIFAMEARVWVDLVNSADANFTPTAKVLTDAVCGGLQDMDEALAKAGLVTLQPVPELNPAPAILNLPTGITLVK